MSKPTPCPRCGFRYQCICSAIPKLKSKINIALLLHPNEVARETNTGRLLALCLPDSVTSYEWHRDAPPLDLLQRIQQPDCQAIVLYPQENLLTTTNLAERQDNKKPLFIIIDATWQEARKILNRSPWLQALPRMQLKTSTDSSFTLRRNQRAGSLCTFEVAEQLLAQYGETQQARQLHTLFAEYQAVYQADKSGHPFHRE